MSSHNCDNCMYQCPHYDNDQIHCHQHVKGFCLKTEVLISPQNWVPAKLEKFERKMEDKEIFIKVWKIRFSWIILPHYIKFQPETHPSKEHAVNVHPSKVNPSKELHLKGHPAKQYIQPTGHPSSDTSSQRNIQSNGIQLSGHPPFSRGEQEGLFGSREREWELKSTFTS